MVRISVLLFLNFFTFVRRAAGQQVTFEIVACSSADGLRNNCSTPYSNITNLKMVRQISGFPCLQGRTWGFDNNGLWVDRGCRADFRVWLAR
jgi:hypothetical protein